MVSGRVMITSNWIVVLVSETLSARGMSRQVTRLVLPALHDDIDVLRIEFN